MLTLVVPATGRYVLLARRLVTNLWKYCRDPHNLRLFVATDAPIAPPNTTRVPWVKQPWPSSTYAKFDMLLTAAADIPEGHVFLMDADTDVTGPWSTDFFTRCTLVALEHHLNTNDRVNGLRSPFEADTQSPAYIPPELHTTRDYATGSLMGGERSVFLDACSTLSANVRFDVERGHINTWHDETQWNGYLYRHPAELIRYSDFSRCFSGGDKGGLDIDFLRS